MPRPDLFPTTFDGKLGHLAEECCEVLLAIEKYRRFGARATDPRTHIEYDNIADIYTELNDLDAAMARFRNVPAPTRD
jgi:NTP pyrophosphatase (non-canonical NTP hydrolase)